MLSRLRDTPFELHKVGNYDARCGWPSIPESTATRKFFHFWTTESTPHTPYKIVGSSRLTDGVSYNLWDYKLSQSDWETRLWGAIPSFAVNIQTYSSFP